ncbi:uncharacterized protein B4U79_00748, partial [Dinothrombium tinctorium]
LELKKWKEERKLRKEERKRKREEEAQKRAQLANDASEGRNYTLSIALPASIVDNAQTNELKAYLIGQIARAAVIFNCDEIVVYDEFSGNAIEEDPNVNPKKRCISKMVKVLQYLECPQYLRRYFFPIQKDLELVGLINPLDTKHHLRIDDVSRFREGVVVNKPVKENSEMSFVNVGLRNDVKVDRCLKPGVRVTVEFEAQELESPKKKLRGTIVSPRTPCIKSGTYWGYSVRVANSLSEVLANSSFGEEYDLTIGTSENGDNVDTILPQIPNDFKHAIIIFGGLKGIEAAMDADTKYANVADPRSIFNFYLNTCPNQGSNTIRTEEAILISLSILRPKLTNK